MFYLSNKDFDVTPAKAGAQSMWLDWIPAFAGMTT